MINIKNSFKTIGRVLSNWKYFGLFILSSIVFYLINIYLGNISNFAYFMSEFGFLSALGLILKIGAQAYKLFPAYGFASIAIISVLTGIMISLLAYKYNVVNVKKKNTGFLSGVAIFFGIIAPGCASCGVGLIAVLGLTASVAYLPLKGLEVSIIAIAILVFATLKISDELFKCNIPKMKGGK